MANPQHLPCNATQTIQGKWNLQGKLHWTTSWTSWGRRGPWRQDYSWSQETGTRISILRPMAGSSYFRCLMGTRTCIFRWWQNTGWLQRTPPPLTFLLSPSRHMFSYQQYNMDEELRSLSCPCDSCRNPVIPVESSGIRWNYFWQRALPKLPFQGPFIPAE